MSCHHAGMTLSALESDLSAHVADAEALRIQKQAQQPGTVPPLCPIPPYPDGATDEQKKCAVLAAIDMVLNYIACLNGPPHDIAACVAAVCDTFSGQRAACFAST